MNNSINTLQEILQALMTINVKGNDAITMGNCLQVLDSVIKSIKVSVEAEKEEIVSSEE